MNCNDAKELIDLLVHDSAEDARELKTPTQWAELEAHLAGCAKCRSEVEELRRVRGLLAEVRSDRPSDKEIETMWAAIQAPVSIREVFASEKTKSWWARNRSLVVSLTGAAAVLMLAFQVGNLRYGKEKGLGRSALTMADASIDPRLGGNYLLGGNLDRRDAAAGVNYSTGFEPADGSTFGLGEDARFPRSAALDKRKLPSPTIAEAVESLQPREQVKSQYDSGVRLDEERLGFAAADVAGPPAPAAPSNGVQHLRISPEPTLDKSTVQGSIPRRARQGFSAQQQTAQRQGELQDLVDQTALGERQVKKSARMIYDNTKGLYWIEGDADEIEELTETMGEPGTPQLQGDKFSTKSLKIIKTGELAIEVAVYNGAVEQVEKIVEQLGAFVADASTHEEAGGALVGRMVIRTSPERFEEVFVALKAVGRVESENVKAADVTAEFVDTEARIHSLKITEERLRELIANKSFVDKIASLLEVERELNRVRTEIEQFEGRLRVMADRIALSTIVLTIREPGRTVPSASLSVEVATLDEASQKLADLLGKTNGRLVSAKTSKRNDGTLLGNFQLETSLAHFAEVVAGIEALGRVQERQVADQQFGKAAEDWASHVKCAVALVLFERSRQLPSGTVRVEVDSLEDAMKGLSKVLQTHDASIASSQANRQSNGADSADIKVRVPAGRFGELVDVLGQLGRGLLKAVSGETEGIVGGAAAVPCELSLTLTERTREVPQGSMNLEVARFDLARQSLSKSIAAHNVQVLDSSSNQRPDETWQGNFRLGIPAREMEAFVKSTESLGRVAGRQISGLGLGDLSRADPDALGVVLLTMSEKSTITPATSEAAGSIRTRVREGLEGFYTSMGLIAYGLVVLLPWLVLAALFAWIVSRVVRRRRMQQQGAMASK